MVLRLAEMSHHSTDQVVAQYRSGGGRGWGALARSLGIKPGSREFHDLKRGHDPYSNNVHTSKKGKGKAGDESEQRDKEQAFAHIFFSLF